MNGVILAQSGKDQNPPTARLRRGFRLRQDCGGRARGRAGHVPAPSPSPIKEQARERLTDSILPRNYGNANKSFYEPQTTQNTQKKKLA
jgi:hypothetical protein